MRLHRLVNTVFWAGVLASVVAGEAPAKGPLRVHLKMPKVVIHPGDDIQAAVDRSPEGTTFLLKAGVHRHQSVIPKNGNTFVGESGAILCGARVLTSFVREGSYWVAVDQTQQGPQNHGVGKKLPDGSRYEVAKFPEDLYFDNKPLWQVERLKDVAPGKWFFDYANDKIYFIDDPSEHKVETSVTRFAFHCGNKPAPRDVTIRGLVIEKYAVPSQHGAVHARSGSHGTLSEGWTVEDCEVRLNHGCGLRLGNRMKVLRNKLNSNGNFGLEGSGDDMLVDGNEIAYNNYAGYEIGWGAGGVKFSLTDRVTVRNNFFHDNFGNALWTDGFNTRTLYENNVIANNLRNGIVHEVAHDAVIRNNVCKGNGREANNWFWGAQILVMNGSPVEITGNRVEVLATGGNGISLVQQNRDPGTTFEITRVEPNRINVHHNDITFLGRNGSVAAGSDHFAEEFLSSLRFDFNTYHVPDLDQRHWALNQYKTWAEVQKLGHEKNGTRDTNIPANGNPSPIVWAGPDLTGAQSSAIVLEGIATDDSTKPLSVIWSKTSGQGTVTFSDSRTSRTSASFSEAGEYILRLTANDGTSSDFDEAKISVEDP